MVALDVVLNGVVLGGLYALVAIGLNFQYGIARIMNLSYGEGLMLAAFSTFWLFTLYQFSPLLSVLAVIPVAFVASWLIFLIFMQPLVKRATNRDMLERDSILMTFGLLFVVQGGALWSWGSQPRGYLYLLGIRGLLRRFVRSESAPGPRPGLPYGRRGLAVSALHADWHRHACGVG